jgi:hypothetical protein
MAIHKALPFAALILATILVQPAAAADDKAAADPFDALAGDWKGGGRVVPSNGDPKNVACKVTYKVSGKTLTQHLRCAGDDYNINATNKMTDKGGKIRGSWNETTYDANGAVAGTARDDTIHARISGDKFSSRMSIKVAGDEHSINIVQLNDKTGTYRLVASLDFHR